MATAKIINGSRNPEAGRLRRFKQITAALSQCFIRAGWEEAYRKEDADRLLRYLERRAKGGGRSGKLEKELQDFLCLHNQSLDYFYDGNPRGMFCRAAADSAVGAVIRQSRKGVSDKWSGIERREEERAERWIKGAKQYLASPRKAKPGRQHDAA